MGSDDVTVEDVPDSPPRGGTRNASHPDAAEVAGVGPSSVTAS
eukprot:CAMPEP_0197598332 /NCGR_PEP_ID=MMETSP1326-20131121/29097_1 /TAXON_ID=1155430 /ORGANISM="Genus nov. species nov., Strain RCC2288" /LENGTH=42 /DNA_ID= /DNA_START= /DNA_END= /DNA_ORIENTATION=